MKWWETIVLGMARTRWAPDGGGGTGEGNDGGTPDDAGSKADGGEKGGTPEPEDVSGLKSALRAQRDETKELRRQMKELQDTAKKTGDAAKDNEALRARLADYELRDTIDAEIDKAIAEATKDGKSAVDRGKARLLAKRLTDPKAVAEGVREIVEAIKTAVAAPKKEEQRADKGERGKRPIEGQPVDEGTQIKALDSREWIKLKREDPEAYRAMIQERRRERKMLRGTFRR